VSRKKIDAIAAELLLDNNQPLLIKLAELVREQLAVALGGKCPMCQGTNVSVQGDTGVCQDCDELYDAPPRVSVQVYRDSKGRIVDLCENGERS